VPPLARAVPEADTARNRLGRARKRPGPREVALVTSSGGKGVSQAPRRCSLSGRLFPCPPVYPPVGCGQRKVRCESRNRILVSGSPSGRPGAHDPSMPSHFYPHAATPKPCWYCTHFIAMIYGGSAAWCSLRPGPAVRAMPASGCSAFSREPGADDEPESGGPLHRRAVSTGPRRGFHGASADRWPTATCQACQDQRGTHEGQR
jgi:hypothetical protein